MSFASASDPLPTASQRYVQLTSGESKLDQPPASVTIEQLSKILDGFFSVSEKATDASVPFLIDPTGFYDIIKYSYEAAADKCKAYDKLSCHEYALVCFWYFYKRLHDIRTAIGYKVTPPPFFEHLDHDLLTAPVFEYLSNLGPIVLPSGLLAYPYFPPPTGVYFPGFFEEDLVAPAPGIERFSGGAQLIMLRSFIEHFRLPGFNASKRFAYTPLGLPPNDLIRMRHVIKAWDFPNPVNGRNFDEVLGDFATGPTAVNYHWNRSILQSYKSFSAASRSSYVWKPYEEVVSTRGSPGQMAMFERTLRDDVVFLNFGSPSSLSANDVTLAVLFRYRCVHGRMVNGPLGNSYAACLTLCNSDMGAPFGIRSTQRAQVLSQVKDFCSYFSIMKA